MARTLLKVALATATFAVLGGGLLRSQTSRTAADWPAYGATNAGSKYSPLDQINKDTVKGLRIAWRQSALPLPVQKVRPDAGAPRAYQHTPLKVGGLLYMSTSLGTVAALDPTSGEVVWFDPPPQKDAGSASRGLAYWTDGKDERIIAISGRFLVALNAKTGQRYADFGTDGAVDLSAGLPPRDARRVQVGRPCHHRARRHRRRGHARRRGGHHQRDRARADGDASRRRPRLRRPHREAAVDVPHRAVAWGVRERDLAERFVVLLRQRRRLVVDGGGRRARVRVSADRDADRRLLRRHAPWQQPLCRKPGGPGRQDRQTCLAFPGCPPRHLGLRLSRAARSRRRHGRWPPHQGDRADLEAGVRLRARSGDGAAGLADRRAAGRAR